MLARKNKTMAYDSKSWGSKVPICSFGQGFIRGALVSALRRGDCIVNRLAYATARSRLPMNGKNGSAEHLYELIRVCLLMQRHKDFILAQKRLIANAQKFAHYPSRWRIAHCHPANQRRLRASKTSNNSYCGGNPGSYIPSRTAAWSESCIKPGPTEVSVLLIGSTSAVGSAIALEI
jgi:hypothetical protein